MAITQRGKSDQGTSCEEQATVLLLPLGEARLRIRCIAGLAA